MAVVDHSHEFDCFVVGGHTPALVVVVEVKTHDATVVLRFFCVTRSEERRVGKECRL